MPRPQWRPGRPHPLLPRRRRPARGRSLVRRRPGDRRDVRALRRLGLDARPRTHLCGGGRRSRLARVHAAPAATDGRLLQRSQAVRPAHRAIPGAQASARGLLHQHCASGSDDRTGWSRAPRLLDGKRGRREGIHRRARHPRRSRSHADARCHGSDGRARRQPLPQAHRFEFDRLRRAWIAARRSRDFIEDCGSARGVERLALRRNPVAPGNRFPAGGPCIPRRTPGRRIAFGVPPPELHVPREGRDGRMAEALERAWLARAALAAAFRRHRVERDRALPVRVRVCRSRRPGAHPDGFALCRAHRCPVRYRVAEVLVPAADTLERALLGTGVLRARCRIRSGGHQDDCCAGW